MSVFLSYISLSLLILTVVLLLYIAFQIRKSNQSETFEKLRELLYSTLNEINGRILDAARENQKQIQNNSDLFNRILESENKLRNELKQAVIDFGERFNEKLHERLEKINSTLNQSMTTTGENINRKLTETTEKITLSFQRQRDESRNEFERFVNKVEDKLDKISSRVDERLKEGFENVDKTFRDIVDGIARISEAQKKIEQLSTQVVSLQEILSDKKTRGIFGEIQLENILRNVFGEPGEMYELQYQIETASGGKVIADCVIKAPQVGFIAVDSKFPLENYRRATQERAIGKYTSEFKRDLKKHIDDIASKYIIPGKTASMAIMFLPAEAIFAEINAYHQDIVEYAYRKQVWIASPTTLMALLTTISAVVRDIKTRKQARKIQEELVKLSKNFALYKQRWEKFMKNIDAVNKEAHNIHITTTKITNAFEKIEKVEFDSEEEKTTKGLTSQGS